MESLYDSSDQNLSMESWYFSGDDSSDQNPDDNFTVLNQKNIEKSQDGDIVTVANVLSVSRNQACSLLMQHEWCVETAVERVLSDLPKNRERTGIEIGTGIESEKISCKICFQESGPNLKFLSLVCSHRFCVDCWERYVSISIQEGPGCLTLTCPEPRCEITVGSDVIDALTSPEDRDTYYSYLRRSYVERCRKRKWCPSPGCEFAVELFNPLSWRNFEVRCCCAHKFCFKCGEESHRPVDCQTARRWIERERTLDSINKTWILAYTKPCPKCNRPIEKNNGCAHMTCAQPCGHHFCWECLGPWTSYNHKCEIQDHPEETSEKDKAKAEAEIERMSADPGHEMMMAKLNKLSNLTADVEFVSKAWEKVIECRRVLRWSYADSHYMSADGNGKRKFFEFLQGQVESVLEKLHQCLERDLDDIILGFDSSMFCDFKDKVLHLTGVTDNHFKEFVKALEEEDP